MCLVSFEVVMCFIGFEVVMGFVGFEVDIYFLSLFLSPALILLNDCGVIKRKDASFFNETWFNISGCFLITDK